MKYLLRVGPNKEEAISPAKSENPNEEKTGLDYDIEKFFRTFAENKGGLTNNGFNISLKAFMYNYKVMVLLRK